MKTTPRTTKGSSAKIAFTLAFFFLAVLLLSDMAYASDKHYRIKNSLYFNDQVCDMTITYADGSTHNKKIALGSTGDWQTSKCISSITGHVDGSGGIGTTIESMYSTVCQSTEWEVIWDSMTSCFKLRKISN